MSPHEAETLRPGDMLRWDSRRGRPRWRWFRVRRVEGWTIHLQPAESCVLGDWGGRGTDRVIDATRLTDYTRVPDVSPTE